MKKIRVGVAGIGFIGPVHIEALRRLPGIEVVSIFNRGLEKVKKKAAQLDIEHYYSDYKDFIQKNQLDCVHLCTPNTLHF